MSAQRQLPVGLNHGGQVIRGQGLKNTYHGPFLSLTSDGKVELLRNDFLSSSQLCFRNFKRLGEVVQLSGSELIEGHGVSVESFRIANTSMVGEQRCTACHRPEGELHVPGCPYAKFTIRRVA